MKKVVVVFSLFMAMTFVAVSANAQTGTQRTNVGQLVSGLINVNVGAINVNAVDLVDVNNVLNNNNVRILDNVLNHSPILSNNSNFLNNLLRNANVLTQNQIVVGVLSSGAIVYQTLPL